MGRINSIDIVRGLVMLLMALDHTRDLIHRASLTEDPLDLNRTTFILFFTRWVTHFCAPIFVFLAGSSVWLSRQNSDLPTLRKFLITRGLWLILLEFTVITFGIWWDVSFKFFLFQVIAALGVGFVILGLLSGLPFRGIGVMGVFIIMTHGLFPLLPISAGSLAESIIKPLFIPERIAWGANTSMQVAYPVIPWLGILLAGYGLGNIFELPREKRGKLFIYVGTFCLSLFGLLRLTNVYGDPAPWKEYVSGLKTFLSFVNVSKYPPSTLYCLLTLGGMFFLLALAENLNKKLGAFLETYGRVPLFYYLIHWYILHILMFFILILQGFGISDFRFGSNLGRPEAAHGLGLVGTYGVWLAVILFLYPLCRGYGQYKMEHREKWWLRYL